MFFLSLSSLSWPSLTNSLFALSISSLTCLSFTSAASWQSPTLLARLQLPTAVGAARGGVVWHSGGGVHTSNATIYEGLLIPLFAKLEVEFPLGTIY